MDLCFIAAASAYDSESEFGLRRTLESFHKVWTNRLLQQKPVILFLNKQVGGGK